ncbi:hypothetical protein B0H17DRAFT_1244029 [Mycena rosella]|uniref:Uncharacterized protein n=1 Tax=Mycena rosella TaxID=1033263 RepID=A0AAD7CZX9_MYCRO|nr:hypothetical protein B0H17DRAFT_1244029 [Mycena rosella]
MVTTKTNLSTNDPGARGPRLIEHVQEITIYGRLAEEVEIKKYGPSAFFDGSGYPWIKAVESAESRQGRDELHGYRTGRPSGSVARGRGTRATGSNASIMWIAVSHTAISIEPKVRRWTGGWQLSGSRGVLKYQVTLFHTDRAHFDNPPSMSTSTSTERFCVIGIHQAPPDLSKKEFETGIETLVANWLELPIVKTNALKMDMIFSNALLEAQTVDNMVAVMQHQESQKLVAGREEFKQERGASVFSGEVTTKIDKPGSKDRAHGIAILKVPEGESPEHFARKLGALLDRFVALPATQKCVSKCTLLHNGKSLENQLNAMGIHTPGRTFVIHMEYESLYHSMEVASDAGILKLLGDAIQDLRVSLVDVSYFGADVIRKFTRK